MTAKRAILFDMDGVLLDGWYSSPQKRHRWDRMMEADLGLDSAAFQTFFPTVFEPEVLTGRKGLEEALGAFLPGIGYVGDPRVVIDYWLARDAKVNESLWNLVASLKATGKVRLYIATNQEHVRAAYLWNDIGFKNLFDDIFYAAAFKTLKPHRAFFAACEERMGPGEDGLPPLFFDDSPAYVEGARTAGWEAYVYEDVRTCLAHPFIREVLS